VSYKKKVFNSDTNSDTNSYDDNVNTLACHYVLKDHSNFKILYVNLNNLSHNLLEKNSR
jgi:hypothetical protein